MKYVKKFKLFQYIKKTIIRDLKNSFFKYASIQELPQTQVSLKKQ